MFNQTKHFSQYMVDCFSILSTTLFKKFIATLYFAGINQLIPFFFVRLFVEFSSFHKYWSRHSHHTSRAVVYSRRWIFQILICCSHLFSLAQLMHLMISCSYAQPSRTLHIHSLSLYINNRKNNHTARERRSK